MKLSILLCCGLLSGCGYSYGRLASGERALPLSLEIVPNTFQEPEFPAQLQTEIVQQLETISEVSVVRPVGAEYHLKLLSVDARIGQESFSDANQRGASYFAQVRLQAQLQQGPKVLAQNSFSAQSPFLSVPGKIEALDGMTRIHRQKAARQIASQISRWLALELRHNQDLAP